MHDTRLELVKMADYTFNYFSNTSFLVLVFIFCSLLGCSKQDILGCGGFLKSSVSIDFSRVEVKLFTKQGILKESSDCAPTNGYYFIPLYDKGEYILKIEPPADWYFEPKEIHLNFDAVNDPCSKAKDINFLFKGFQIQGKVVSQGTTVGPENAIIKLVSETDKSVQLETTTGDGGQFQFSPVLPGTYSVTATHKNYVFTKNSFKITVREGSLVVPEGSLVIGGYDVSGQVLFHGEPTVGVNLVLFANDPKNRNIKIEGCSKAPLNHFKNTDFICHVASDENGVFRYKTVPPGSYTIRPHYAKFDVQPKQIDVVVKHDHLTLDEKFLVKGFSVSGRVLKSVGGSGLKGAEIYLKNNKVAVTDQEGRYTLDSMEPGTYELFVRAENVKFDVVPVKLSPNTLEIESIYPSEFNVCGLVTSVTGQQSRVVEIEAEGEPGKMLEAKVERDTGKFCHFLKPGKYNLAVKLSDFEKSSGMQYVPLVRQVNVRNTPISDIEFTQLRGNIRGRVVKLPESPKAVELSVKLKLKNSLVALKILEGNNLEYVFNEVMPGTYDVEVENNLWCFEREVHSISVSSAETAVPDFVQTGYKIKVKSSHRTSAVLRNADAPKRDQVDQGIKLELAGGENTHCVPNSNSYKLVPVGCHGYEKEFYVIDPRQGTTLTLNAVSHDVTGFIRSPDPEPDLVLNVIHSNDQTTRLGPLKSERDSTGYIHRFTFRSPENQVLKFIPISSKLLFRPDSIEYVTTGDCAEDAVQFTGEKGLIIQGGIAPPLDDVKVTLKTTEEEFVFMTQADGKYKFGPLRSTSNFEITAEKESYILSGPDKNGIFKAHKLAKINVKVIDNASKEPLQGVLLSLTGGEKYRKNSMTGEVGFLSFHSLSPGEYFLRPMMKEYKFDPSSQIIQVKEGVTESIELRGRRVSFSAYGTITSLNGEPEPNVVIEAMGLNTCSNLLEETSSEANGEFRIRGLLPQCEYQIRLKHGLDVNSRIHRLEPTDLQVQTNKGDVQGLELVAFHMLDQMDLSVHVESTIPEHLKSLRLKLCKENEPDSPVYSVKLDTVAGGSKHWGNAASQERFLKAGLLIHLPFVPRDKSSYFIQLESNLNKHTYSYKESIVHFTADKTFRNFKMTFDPSLKTLDHELSQRNYIIVPLLIFGVLVYTYFSKAAPVVQNFFGTLNQTSFSFAKEERNFYSHNNVMDAVSIEPVPVSVTKRKVKSRKV